MNAPFKLQYGGYSREVVYSNDTAQPVPQGIDRPLVLERTDKFLEQMARGGELRSSDSSTLETSSKLEETTGMAPRQAELEEEVGNVIRFSAPRLHPERPTISIVAVQEWEGVIDAVFDEHFEATMVDVSADAYRPTERMEIPLSLIDDDERGTLKPGIIFRLVIGRERRNGGQIQNKTLVYIRKAKFRTPSKTESSSFGELIREWI